MKPISYEDYYLGKQITLCNSALLVAFCDRISSFRSKLLRCNVLYANIFNYSF